jgi:hypothetical protein
LIRLRFADQHSQQWILAELLVVVQVFIAQRQSVHALGQHVLDCVLYQGWVAAIQKALAESIQKIHSPVRLPQQQRASIGADCSTIELCYYLTSAFGAECKSKFATLCHRKAVSFLG